MGYDFWQAYCQKNNIQILWDDRETGGISTGSIDSLKAFTEDGTEIKGLGVYIEGYEINIIGIAYPFYDREFPHHLKAYQNRFKSNLETS